MTNFQNNSPRGRQQEQLKLLQSHAIFEIARERPLIPDEVGVYLAVKAKIAAIEDFGASPVEARSAGPGYDGARSRAQPRLASASPFDLD